MRFTGLTYAKAGPPPTIEAIQETLARNDLPEAAGLPSS
jgi:hypothetical protein